MTSNFAKWVGADEWHRVSVDELPLQGEFCLAKDSYFSGEVIKEVEKRGLVICVGGYRMFHESVPAEPQNEGSLFAPVVIGCSTRARPQYDPKIWHSISNKNQMIARVPDCEHEDLEKVEAKIKELDPEMWRHFRESFVHSLMRHFLRCSRGAERIELSAEEFAAFRKNGGQVA